MRAKGHDLSTAERKNIISNILADFAVDPCVEVLFAYLRHCGLPIQGPALGPRHRSGLPRPLPYPARALRRGPRLRPPEVVAAHRCAHRRAAGRS